MTVKYTCIVTGPIFSVHNVVARLTFNSFLIPGSRSEFRLITVVSENTQLAFHTSSILTASISLQVNAPTTIQIVLNNDSSVLNTTSPSSIVQGISNEKIFDFNCWRETITIF